MSFFPIDNIVPEMLEGEDFVLLPLTPAHVEVDYEAVMASQEMLRIWSGSTWPRDGFTLAENLDDLKWHWQEHQDREAFTYTVLDPDQEICLGCVYIRPLMDLAAANREILANNAEDEAVVRFWARSSHQTGGLDQRLLKALIEWFSESWPFSRVLFHTRPVNSQQIALFAAASLQKQYALQYSQRGGIHYFFGDSLDS